MAQTDTNWNTDMDINKELFNLIKENIETNKSIADNQEDIINILTMIQQSHNESASDHKEIIGAVSSVIKDPEKLAKIIEAVKDPEKLSTMIETMYRLMFSQDFMGVEMLRDVKRYGMVDRLIKFIWFAGISWSIISIAAVIITVLVFMGR